MARVAWRATPPISYLYLAMPLNIFSYFSLISYGELFLVSRELFTFLCNRHLSPTHFWPCCGESADLYFAGSDMVARGVLLLWQHSLALLKCGRIDKSSLFVPLFAAQGRAWYMCFLCRRHNSATGEGGTKAGGQPRASTWRDSAACSSRTPFSARVLHAATATRRCRTDLHKGNSTNSGSSRHGVGDAKHRAPATGSMWAVIFRQQRGGALQRKAAGVAQKRGRC